MTCCGQRIISKGDYEKAWYRETGLRRREIEEPEQAWAVVVIDSTEIGPPPPIATRPSCRWRLVRVPRS